MFGTGAAGWPWTQTKVNGLNRMALRLACYPLSTLSNPLNYSPAQFPLFFYLSPQVFLTTCFVCCWLRSSPFCNPKLIFLISHMFRFVTWWGELHLMCPVALIRQYNESQTSVSSGVHAQQLYSESSATWHCLNYTKWLIAKPYILFHNPLSFTVDVSVAVMTQVQLALLSYWTG